MSASTLRAEYPPGGLPSFRAFCIIIVLRIEPKRGRSAAVNFRKVWLIRLRWSAMNGRSMNWRYLSSAILFFGGALSVSFNKACADTDLSIVTSYPSAFYEPIRQAFERLHPDIHLKISNRKTTSAVAAIIDGTRTPADIFWASSPDAFEVLKQAGRLARLPARSPRPLSLGANPIDDPDGFYAGFAISGYGIVWNTQDLAERRISPPTSIKSLAESRYRG